MIWYENVILFFCNLFLLLNWYLSVILSVYLSYTLQICLDFHFAMI